MHVLLQACILGLLTGAVYALMASGLTIAFGVMRVINVAQGALIILGAYLSYELFVRLQIDPFVSILVLTPLTFMLGVGLQLVFIRPLRSDEREELSLLVTWAIALGIEGVLSVLFSTTYRSTNTSYADNSWVVGGYHLSEVRVFAFALSLGLLGLLFVLLGFTRLGRAIRATVQNPTSARLLGVNGDVVSAIGFGLSVATATAAGAVYGIIFPFNPGSHYDLISRVLSIIVLGGLGSLGGAVVAALFMGVLEAVFAVEISPEWSSFVFFIVLIGMLVVRPQGLFGSTVRGSL
jgi:branched-chain amino acid transport system permease protein